jgi:purine-nucleoside phosphorylase
MSVAEKRRLRVFLCHSSGDKPAVRELYQRLLHDGFSPWLDEVDLLGGILWESAIEDTVRKTDVVVVCLTGASVTKEGFVQREIELALDVADEKPQDRRSILPLILDECDPPRRLRKWNGIDYRKPNAHSKLFESLSARAKEVGAFVPPRPAGPTARRRAERGKERTAFDLAGEAADFILGRTDLRPRIGIILGSGLGGYADSFAGTSVVDYSEVPHFAVPSSIGHAGRVVVGVRVGVPLVAMQGRVHLYEGHSADEVVFPVRTLIRMGIRAVVITAAAGLLNPAIPMGSLVVVSDHIHLLLGGNALIGSDNRFGPRFVDMSEVYSRHYRGLALETARAQGIPLVEGVYLAHQGPMYETPAEVRFMRNQGVDIVGMSTVPEATVAHHAGLRVLALCVGTSHAAGVPVAPMTHEDAMAAGLSVRNNLAALLDGLIPRIALTL